MLRPIGLQHLEPILRTKEQVSEVEQRVARSDGGGSTQKLRRGIYGGWAYMRSHKGKEIQNSSKEKWRRPKSGCFGTTMYQTQTCEPAPICQSQISRTSSQSKRISTQSEAIDDKRWCQEIR